MLLSIVQALMRCTSLSCTAGVDMMCTLCSEFDEEDQQEVGFGGEVGTAGGVRVDRDC